MTDPLDQGALLPDLESPEGDPRTELTQRVSRATRTGSRSDATRVLEHLEGLARLLGPLALYDVDG